VEHFITSPHVLSQSSYLAYGGAVGAATVAQLNAAFCIAEEWAQSEMRCPIVTTVLTGTFSWPIDGMLQLPHNNIQAVNSVVSLEGNDCDCAYVELSGCAFLLHPETGIISLRNCNCGGSVDCGTGPAGGPHQVRVVYTSGYPSGQVSSMPGVMLALVTVAQMAIRQMSAPWELEGGPGAPGVQEWMDGPYREVRTKLFSTMYGTSPLAAYAKSLLEPLRTRRCLRLY